jgi:LytS/YehU family sensor histidine kinase
MLPRGMQPTVFSALSQVMVVGTSVAIKVTTRWYETQAKISAMEKEKSAAELQQLKNQLNPHFLFNSLNNIYALIAFNPQHAQLAVHNLSDMLRYLLYEASKERISLQKELEFVRDYCDLIKLRITENVRLTLTLPKDDKGVSIAPLLLIAPVENAFKHGVSPTKPSYIHISIEVDDRHTVTCTVRNSSFPKTYADKSGSGIGLENLRKRLNLIYPNRHRWTAKEQNGEFTAQIRIYRIPPETA